MIEETAAFIRSLFDTDAFIPLHEPRFVGNEEKYVSECIQSTFVSSVGKFVDRFEEDLCKITGSPYAIATVNGTAALHLGLLAAGVKPDELVITQALTFVATGNAISYCGAAPVFLDVDPKRLSLSPESLREYLEDHTIHTSTGIFDKASKKRIAACVPVHIFGHAADMDSLVSVCEEYGIPLVEDAAEGMGASYKGKALGTIGEVGTLSFNGNKIVTCGGGGAVLCKDEKTAKWLKHISTTAKVPHPWEYRHDELGYNYRLPNLNAALACAQLENLDMFIENKRALAREYSEFFQSKGVSFVEEPEDSFSNYWLNAILLDSYEEREEFLRTTNKMGVMTRPAWTPLNELEIHGGLTPMSLENSKDLSQRLVNIPSSCRVNIKVHSC